MTEPSERDYENARLTLGPTKVDAIAQAIAFGREEGRREALEWRPIATAPKDGSDIDLWVSGAFHRWRETAVAWRDDRWVTARGPLRDHATPTHWMPLPEPPDA